MSDAASKARELMEKARKAKAAKESGTPTLKASTVVTTTPVKTTGSSHETTLKQSVEAPEVEVGVVAAPKKQSVFSSLSRGTFDDLGIEYQFDDSDDEFSEKDGDDLPLPPKNNFTYPARTPASGYKPGQAYPPRNTQSPQSTGANGQKTNQFADLARLSKERKFASNSHDSERTADKTTNKNLPPDPEWSDKNTPPGSQFSFEQWEFARQYGSEEFVGSKLVQGANQKFCVIEVRNAKQSALLTIKKRPDTEVHKVYADKKSAKYTEVIIEPAPEQCKGTLDPLFFNVFDGCLLLAPSAKTTHPRAISGEMVMRTHDEDLGEMTYRLVRPESHRTLKQWLYNLQGSFDVDAIGQSLPREFQQEINPAIAANHSDVASDVLATDDESDSIMRATDRG